MRNMVHVGVSERIVMTVMGHKRQSMLDRYHIISPSGLQHVARRLSSPPKSAQFGHSEP